MFVQVIRGRTSDAPGFRNLMHRWDEEVRPGADGFLGSTGGVTADGEVVAIVRFADEAAARHNSERPEQSAWWGELEAKFDGPPTFAESSEVDAMLGGGSDEAGFVQVMEGSIQDPDAARDFDRDHESDMRDLRPDLLGSVRVVLPDNRFSQAAYFTSEDAARNGESGDMPADMAAAMESYMANVAVERFLDLTDPMIN